MKQSILLIIVLSLIAILSKAQGHSDAGIIGHVVSKGEHIPYVNIYLEGANYGTTTDVTRHYMMVDLPVGEFTLVAKMVGYTEKRKMCC